MKKIFETWGDFLNKDSDDQQDISSLSPNSKLKLFNKASKRINEKYGRNMKKASKKISDLALGIFGHALGAGSYRKVFPVDDHRVLKVAYKGAFTKISKSLSENKKEADFYIQTKFKDIIPKTYEAAHNYLWIVSDRVTPLGDIDSSKRIEAFKKSFPYIMNMYDLYYENYGFANFMAFLKNITRFLKYWKHISQFDDKQKRIRLYNKIANNIQELVDIFSKRAYVKEFFKKFDINKLSDRYRQLLGLMLEQDATAWDLFTTKNLGVDNEGKIVVMDISSLDDSLTNLNESIIIKIK